jgi:acetolactate synthase-1/2/3 large subunit
MALLVRHLQNNLPANALICNGAGNFASWLHRYFQYQGWSQGFKTQLAPTNGAMGYGVPAAIGASISTGRLAVVFTGDGDFMMNGQELATAVQYGAKVIIILLNNGMYGTIRMHQEREFPTHISGSSLHNPDFVALAKAYGALGFQVKQEAEFEQALSSSLAHVGVSLIEILIEPELITTRVSLNSITQQSILKRQ